METFWGQIEEFGAIKSPEILKFFFDLKLEDVVCLLGWQPSDIEQDTTQFEHDLCAFEETTGNWFNSAAFWIYEAMLISQRHKLKYFSFPFAVDDEDCLSQFEMSIDKLECQLIEYAKKTVEDTSRRTKATQQHES